MSILSVIVRTHPRSVALLRQWLEQQPGVEVALDPCDGRLVLLIEDAPGRAASATMAEIALYPLALNTSLVYEYSGNDVPSAEAGVAGYSAWRSSLKDLAAHRGGIDPAQASAQAHRVLDSH
jgi:nitrate reductase NapAB chaperone NapD